MKQWLCRLSFLVVMASGSMVQGGVPVWIAIYDHSDGSAKGPVSLQRFLTEEKGFRCERVTPAEIREGRLAAFDVLIVPGGSGSKQAKMLEPEGRKIIQEFVRNGGGYIGICAGSYLASSDYEWSLNLINAKVFDRQHWARGTGDVQLKVSTTGQEVLTQPSEAITVYYGQGPLLIPDDEVDLPAFESLATYASEIAEKGAPKGVMIGTTAIARSQYGQGRVVCYSCHPETKPETEHMIIAGVKWIAEKRLKARPAEAAATTEPAASTTGE